MYPSVAAGSTWPPRAGPERGVGATKLAASRFVLNVFLAVGSVTAACLLTEVVLRRTPLAERFGWNDELPVERRRFEAGAKRPGESRWLALGDSFASFGDREGANFLRIAESEARRAGLDVRLSNLGQSTTGLKDYIRNFEQFHDSLLPDLVIAALYLGNDVLPYRLAALERTLPPQPQPPGPASTWERHLMRKIGRKSILLDTFLGLLRQSPRFQSGVLEANLAYLGWVHGLGEAELDRRLVRLPPGVLEAARADAINPWDLAVGVAEPGFYLDTLAMADETGHSQAARDFGQDLGRLVELARRRETPLVVVLIPPSCMVNEAYHAFYTALGYRMEPSLTVGAPPLVRWIETRLAEQGVPTLDLTAALRRAQGALYLEQDIHFNAEGQRVAGLELARFLRERELAAFVQTR